MKKNLRILFLCRKNDIYSKKLSNYLKQNFKDIKIFESSKHNEKTPSKVKKWNGDIILSFRSYLILSKKVLRNAKLISVNFHPGPPKYRGIGCINYAIYNNEKVYGVTAHLMSPKIDEGKILFIKKFKLKKNINLKKALSKTHSNLFNLAISVIKLIKNQKDIKNYFKNIKTGIKWSRNIKYLKDLENFYIIKNGISKKELQKKLRATVTKNFKPYIYLHKKKFIYDDDK